MVATHASKRSTGWWVVWIQVHWRISIYLSRLYINIHIPVVDWCSKGGMFGIFVYLVPPSSISLGEGPGMCGEGLFEFSLLLLLLSSFLLLSELFFSPCFLPKQLQNILLAESEDLCSTRVSGSGWRLFDWKELTVDKITVNRRIVDAHLMFLAARAANALRISVCIDNYWKNSKLWT